MSDTAHRSSTTELVDAVGGPLDPGELAVLVARRGVGKSAVLAHLATDLLQAGACVLHVALGDDVTHVRLRYDEAWRQRTGNARAESDVERRRMVLSYTERSFDPTHLAAQVRMLVDVAGFHPALIVIDGLDVSSLDQHGPAIVALLAERGLSGWLGVSTNELHAPEPAWSKAVVELVATEQGVGLRVHASATRVMLAWTPEMPNTRAVGAAGVVMSESEEVRPVAAECTLYSGGAAGSEAAFGEAAARHGLREVHFTFDGHKQARTEGAKNLSAQELEAGDVSLVYVSRRLHRTYNEHGLIRKILQTLWHMVSRSQQIFVIGAIQEDGTVVGGTGWSVELARMWRKELWVYDQERSGWFLWDGQAWQPGTASITSHQICGTGTRYLEPNGQAAIDDLFARAFGG
jgi:hypothetical protein